VTRDEWLAGRDPRVLLDNLPRLAPPVLARKLRLFESATLRRVWERLDAGTRDEVETIERMADDPAADQEGDAALWEGRSRCGVRAAREVVRHAAVLVGGVFVNERAAQADLVRELFGDPFAPSAFDDRWRTADVLALARAAYDDQAFDRLPVLADALEEAGCIDAGLLAHCRGGAGHVRGCWALDLVLGLA
jgi:hypothetical protein